MKNIPRILTFVSAIFLAMIYFFPVWEITLFAPQYPEGLFMTIWINHIGNDYALINVLNHYIGMKLIVPEQIPELKILPVVFGFLISGSAVLSIINKQFFYRIWSIFLCLFALVCMIDFFAWGYDYGHNLNPNAPLKFPGMSFQPPLFGMKQILNMTSFSYPGWGGIAFAVAIVLNLYAGFGALVFDWIKKRLSGQSLGRSSKIVLMCLAINIGSQGCETKTQAFALNKESCEHCKMVLSSLKFGAELILKTGKVLKFDAIDCLFNYVEKSPSEFLAKISKIYVVHFAENKETQFLEAQTAAYLKSSELRAPMGLGLAAFQTAKEAQSFLDLSSIKGELLTWLQVKALFPKVSLE